MSDKPKMKFNKRKESREIHEGQIVRVTKMNHIVEVLHLALEPNALIGFTKIDKYTYRNNRTGEILHYNLSETRMDNIAGVKESTKKIRNLINNNFTGEANEIWHTTTYAENMTDKDMLYRDNEVYWKRFKRKYPSAEYICVVEPQARGAWHTHWLIKDPSRTSLFIPNAQLAEMWGHGFVTTKRPKSVDNIGAYLSAYLCDLEVTEENIPTIMQAINQNQNVFETVTLDDGTEHTIQMHDKHKIQLVEKDIEVNGKKVKKQFAKGARLFMYPVGMNLYRCSRGIIKPETYKDEYGEIKEIAGRQPSYSKTIDLIQDDKVVNSITYEQYNLKRGKVKAKIRHTETTV